MIATLISIFTSITIVYAASGETTFNDFSTQSGVACSGFSPTNSQGTNIFAAALGDLSPLWTGPKCQGTVSASNCDGHGDCINCTGPPCVGQGTCGQCFNIKCTGSLEGETSGSCTGNTITVKVVDACPSEHPENYCKTIEFGGTVPDNGACRAPGVNQFDIATTARSTLSTFQGNLLVDIEGPLSC
ncbi:hypothetical protein K439DRAFT_1333077 [Ramaria rubella]|nr:hypothetical protein K439DRAFT_1333077 [Ramaria rubella]